MSESTPALGAPRPLPPHPSLEFERKRAKKLLREMRRAAGDASGSVKLADAQFAIAREYGFRSWPRLVEYLEALERQLRSGPKRVGDKLESLDARAQSILAAHERRGPTTARLLGMFVPRCYGLTVEEILAMPVSLDDARLVVARENRLPSWEALVDRVASATRGDWRKNGSALAAAYDAQLDRDFAALERIVAGFPDLLHLMPDGDPVSPIVHSAVFRERQERTPEARRVVDMLGAHGADIRGTLSFMLLSFFMHTKTEDVAYLLERGADPNWMPPNGITVLEHALLKYWNGEAVDLITRRAAPPRQAFWIAAGLGDLRALERYIDRRGTITEAARRHRPDFLAVGPALLPSSPADDDDAVIAEAFMIAAINGRFAVVDALLERGFPIDYAGWEMTLLGVAAGNLLLPLAEALVARGANPTATGTLGKQSAREVAELRLQGAPTNPAARRMVELCGGRPQ